MSTIYIVRHGNTFEPGEPVRRIGARTDLPLTESGRGQAERLRAWFLDQHVPIGAAWAGPLVRTRETAAIVLAGSGVTAEPAHWLAEIDHGPDEGLGEDAVLTRIGGDALARWDRDGVPPPGWLVDADARKAAWRSFLGSRAVDGTTALCVTSNGAARFALLAQPELAAEAATLPSLKLRTGAWGRLVHRRGAWHVDAWDQRP